VVPPLALRTPPRAPAATDAAEAATVTERPGTSRRNAALLLLSGPDLLEATGSLLGSPHGRVVSSAAFSKLGSNSASVAASVAAVDLTGR